MNLPRVVLYFFAGAQAVAASDNPNRELAFSANAATVASIGETVTFTLKFANQSPEPVRIYLVRSEVFRCLQSMLQSARAADGAIIDLQPAPRPHGYVVDESDFYLIPAGGSFSATQSLHLDPARFKAGEKYVVTWIYANDITRWLAES